MVKVLHYFRQKMVGLHFGLHIFCKLIWSSLLRVERPYQGDQMSLWKNRPKYSQNHFSSILIQNFFPWKKYKKIWAPSIIFTRLSIVNNAHWAKIRPIWSPCSWPNRSVSTLVYERRNRALRVKTN
jgi:hypothetical protein